MKRFLIIFTAVAVAACGGSGGNNNTTAGIDGRGGPARAAVVSKGTITGFGSIIVNGVTYDTSGASFGIDGRGGQQSDLAVGDVVLVEGTVNEDGTNAVADTVTFDDAVEGPIGAIDLTAQTLTVLGQLVFVDADTSFDDSIAPRSLDGLAVTDVVEVSGFVLADGSISATRIESKPAGGEFEVTGTVSDVVGMTFRINGLLVDFSIATPQGFPNGTPEEGQLVEAKGTVIGGAGQLFATSLEFKGNELGDDGDQAELEGFITRFVSASDFDVEGIPVTTDAQTVYENGSSADLAINRKVEVEGDINAAGVLVAEKVEFKATGELRVESLVEAVQSNQLTVLGIVIRVDASTRYEDDSAADLEVFSLSNVVVGNYVEIRGYDDGSGIVATQLRRDDFQGDVALRGFAEDVSDPQFTILGVTVTTDAGTEYFDSDESPLDGADFFAQAEGRLVEASGTLNGGIDAAEVEFED